MRWYILTIGNKVHRPYLKGKKSDTFAFEFRMNNTSETSKRFGNSVNRNANPLLPRRGEGEAAAALDESLNSNGDGGTSGLGIWSSEFIGSEKITRFSPFWSVLVR